MSEYAENPNNINPVVKRIAFKAHCHFSSPALIGSGLDEKTNSDIIRDNDGRAYLPGSSVAGALRSSVTDEVAQMLFDKDKISPLWVFDSDLTDGNGSGAKVMVLDGVEIDKLNKVALKKYDYEAIEPGSEFILRFLLIIRKDDVRKGYESAVARIIGAIESAQVAFGAKTRRGFGIVKCSMVVKREFDLAYGNTTALDDWIGFDWNADYGKWEVAEGIEFFADIETITAELELSGSIMIRNSGNIYKNLPKDNRSPDYKHISIGEGLDEKPVILGTSWAGAFRSGLYKLLEAKYSDKVKAYIDDVFGYVSEEDRTSEPSKILFETSTLEETVSRVEGYRNVTRVKIDRFTGGASDGALFTERPWYGGKTILKIHYPKERMDICELILLGIDCLDKGIIQIGGESSVGRGFFRVAKVSIGNGDVPLDSAKLKLRDKLTKVEEVSADEA